MLNGTRLRCTMYLRMGQLWLWGSDTSWASLADTPGVPLGASAFSLLFEYMRVSYRLVLQVWEASVFFRGRGEALL